MAPGKPPLSPFLLRRGLKVRRGCSGAGWDPPIYSSPLLPLLPPPKMPQAPCGALPVGMVTERCALCQLCSALGTRCRRCAGTGGHTPPCAPWHPRHGAAPAPGVTPVPLWVRWGEQLVPAERDPAGALPLLGNRLSLLRAERRLCPACAPAGPLCQPCLATTCPVVTAAFGKAGGAFWMLS